jgi:predicted TPR repeat methyltransferase
MGATMSGAPDDVDARIAEGAAANQDGDFEGAAAAYRQALRMETDNFEAAFGLAAAFRALGDYQEAERFYEKALAMDPSPAEPYWELGYTREMLGDNQGAMVAYEACLARNEGHGVARHLMDALMGTTTDAAPDDYVAALFNDYAEDFERSMAEDLHYSVPASMARKLAAVCAADPPGQRSADAAQFPYGLDLGAGTGLTGAAIAAFASDLHGVDLSSEMLELAKARAVYSHTFVAGMTEFLAEPMAGAHKNYDLMISGDALVYVGDLAPLFAGAYRRLNPGGWFLFTVELANAGDFILQSTGRYAHGPEFLRATAAKAGFEPGSLDPITPRRDADQDIQGLLGAFRRL